MSGMVQMELIQIGGAGPAGLAAAIIHSRYATRVYTQFNGADNHCDGFGRNANDNLYAV
ncbi:MAG: hypothetical protein ACYCZQ_15665 [Burkholderiales bacterium]